MNKKRFMTSRRFDHHHLLIIMKCIHHVIHVSGNNIGHPHKLGKLLFRHPLSLLDIDAKIQKCTPLT